MMVHFSMASTCLAKNQVSVPPSLCQFSIRRVLNNEEMLIDQIANKHGHDNQQLKDEQVLVNNDEVILLKQDAAEQMDHNHQMENNNASKSRYCPASSGQLPM